MSFLNPWVLWLGLAAVPLVGAFLLRRYRRRVDVSSVVIYRRMAQMSHVRRRFALPHHLVALLLSILAMAALLMAASHPQGSEIEPRQYIVVIDTSASMGAVEPGHTSNRLGRGVDALGEFVDDLNEHDQLALIAAGPEAGMVVGWTHQHELVPEAAANLSALGTGAGLRDALEIADALCRAPDTTEIVLVSDGASGHVPSTNCPIRFVKVGDTAANLAIVGFTVREADGLGLKEIYLAVHNGSDEAREINVQLELDSILFDVVAFEVEAGSTVEHLRRIPLPPGEVLRAALIDDGEQADALTVDDEAFAVLRPISPVNALLITSFPTTFLAEALRIHPRVALTVQAPEAVDPAAGPFDLIVVDSAYPGDLPEAPRLLVFNSQYERFGFNTSGTVRTPHIIRWSFDDPLFRFVNLDGAHLSAATATTLPDDAQSLADMGDGPLIFAAERDGRSLMFFTFHPDQSDLPLRVAFVNMVANLVEWAQTERHAAGLDMLVTGQRLPSDLSLQLLSTTNPLAPALAPGDEVRESGVLRVMSADGVDRGLVAANLFSPQEAAIEPIQRLGIGAAYGWPESMKAEAFPWWMLAAAAIGLLLLEWLLPLLNWFAGRERKTRRRRLSELTTDASSRNGTSGTEQRTTRATTGGV